MREKMAQASEDAVEEARWQGHRLVMAHNPQHAAGIGALRGRPQPREGVGSSATDWNQFVYDFGMQSTC